MTNSAAPSGPIPQRLKPYVKRGKNDAVDADAHRKAMSRPTLRFVPVKSAARQAALLLVNQRDRLIRNGTQLANALHGNAAQFSVSAARGMAHVVPLLERIHAGDSLPILARACSRSRPWNSNSWRANRWGRRHTRDERDQRLNKIPASPSLAGMTRAMEAGRETTSTISAMCFTTSDPLWSPRDSGPPKGFALRVRPCLPHL
jgi:hypothetical protein